MRNTNFSKGMILLILGFILPMLFVLILYYPIFSTPGLIFHGDEGWYLYFNSSLLIKDILYAWANGTANTSNSIPYFLLELLLSIFGSYFANHAMVFLLAYLPGVIAYFSIYKTIRLLYRDERYIYAAIFSVIGSTFYLINWQNYGLTNPTLTWAFSYMVLPALTYLLIKIYKERKVKDVFIFAMISAIGDPVPAWMFFISIMAIFMLVGIIVFNIRHKKSFLPHLKTTGYLILFTFLANAYSLFETIEGFISQAGGAYIKYGTPSSEIIAAKGESFFNWIDVLMFGQSKFYSFGINPQNWTLLNISIVIFAILLIILTMYLRNTKPEVKNLTIFFAVILFLSLFLAKGFNPPLGFLYKYVIVLSPPGLVGITLDVEPWYILSALSYSFIYSIGVYTVVMHLFLRKNSMLRELTHPPIKKIIIFIVLIILILSSLFSALYTTDVELKSYTYPAFSPKFYPEPYINVTDYIEEKFPDAYVTWIPYSGAYEWEDNYSIKSLLSDLGGDLSEHFVNPDYIYSYLDQSNFTDLATLLSLSDIRLLILDKSGQLPGGLSFNDTLNFLDNQSSLVQIYRTGWLYVFKNTQNFSTIQSGIPALNDSYPSVAGILPIPGLSQNTIYSNTSNSYYLAYLTDTISGNETTDVGWNGTYGSFAVYRAYPTNYAYDQQAFKIDNMSINGSMLTLNLSYHIPKILRNYSGNLNGTFYPGFSPEIQGFPSNDNPEWVSMVEGGNNREYLQLNYKQYKINNTCGFLQFSIPNVPGTSLYINYYGSGFTNISPLYYVASENKNGQFEETPLGIKTGSNFTEFERLNRSELIRPYVIQVSKPKIITGYLYDDALYVQPIAVYQNVSLDTFNNILNTSNLILDLYANNISKTNVFQGDPLNNIPIKVDNLTTLHFATPMAGNYNITLKVLSGSVSFANHTFATGDYRFSIYLDGIGSLVFRSLNASIAVNAHRPSPQNESITTGNIIEDSPVQYSFSYLSSTGGLVIFKKSYSPLWTAYFKGKKYSPISLNGGTETGFLLPHGSGKVTIYYLLQTYFDIGSIITIVFFCFATLFLMRRRRNG
jgi:hypothetical protein